MLQKYERYDGCAVQVTIFFHFFSYYVKIQKTILYEPYSIMFYWVNAFYLQLWSSSQFKNSFCVLACSKLSSTSCLEYRRSAVSI
jgi:hypothetical protein